MVRRGPASDPPVARLEMRARPSLQAPRPFRAGMLLQLRDPTVSFYRYLLQAVGRGRLWSERLGRPDAELAAHLGDDRREVWLLSIGGVPAGFYEIDRTHSEVVVLAGAGLVPEFRGRGLGRYLLAAAVEAAWESDPAVVRVEVPDIDDPRALLLLQWAGFRAVAAPLPDGPDGDGAPE
jgi:GNAT superfamily N-acetyltransferase